MSVDALRDFLRQLPPGPVKDVKPLVALLAEVWDEFDGAGQSAMRDYKLRRMENVEWNPPILSFDMERHGGTVLGSVYAELQGWGVNVETLSAFSDDGFRPRKRLVGPRESPVNVKPIAAEIVAAILAGNESPYLRWRSPSDVTVLTAIVFPTNAGFKETQSARRKRLRNEIIEALTPQGWKQTTANRFTKVARID